jgi:hypothetical protein
LLLLLGLTVAGPVLAQAPAAAPSHQGNRVDYRIGARYNGETHRLEGQETITWTNGRGVATSELWFHLYLNAFSNNRSTFAIEGSAAHEDDEWGWSRIKAIKVNGQDVFGTFEYTQPDTHGAAGYELLGKGSKAFLAEDDRTVFKVSLESPIEPGQTAEVRLSWTSAIPRVRRRTGYKDEFLLMAQWFPKLGVFEGEAGWNCHQFHPSTEFFSDYGSYHVTLNLPEEYSGKVGGSGVMVTSRTKNDDRIEVEFEAPSPNDQKRVDMFGKLPVVHDFTWTADPKYRVEEFQFTWDDWKAKSPAHEDEVKRVRKALGPDARIALRDVKVTVMIHPERLGQARRHFEATANALFFYGLWFGEYPYEHITVVDPVWGDNRAGGMEYPTLFTAGTGLFTSPDEYRPESVTVHECGHQFWYGLVGNNEFESAWLDEGFNSFADSEALLRAYGPRRSTTRYSRLPFDGVRSASLPSGGRLGDVLNAREWKWDFDLLDGLPVIEKIAHGVVRPLPSSGMVDWWRDQPFSTLSSQWSDPRWDDRSGYLSSADEDPIDMDAWTYVSRRSYRANSYPRPAVALRSMIGLVGYDAFLRGMRHYSRMARYGHPVPEDFFDAFNEGAGVDLSWYFKDAFQSTKTIDWSVTVHQERAEKREGWFQTDGGRFREIEDIEKQAAEEAAEAEAEAVLPGTEGTGEGQDVLADSISDDLAAAAAAEPAEPEAAGDSDEDTDENDEPKTPWLIQVTLQRRGELCLPLPWRIEFENGDPEEGVWTRDQQLKKPWVRLRLEDDRKLKSVVLDPKRRYYFDGDMSDNQWYADGDEVAPLRWAERVLNQYGHLLHWYGGIGG